MFAVIGRPGGSNHRFQHFSMKAYGSVLEARRASQDWLREQGQRLEEECGALALGIGPREIISDKVARTVRYRDGSRVYYERRTAGGLQPKIGWRDPTAFPED